MNEKRERSWRLAALTRAQIDWLRVWHAAREGGNQKRMDRAQRELDEIQAELDEIEREMGAGES